MSPASRRQAISETCRRTRPAYDGRSRQAYPPASGRPGGRWSSACTSSTGWCRAGRQARLTAICWWLVFPGTARLTHGGVTPPSRARGHGRQKRRARVPAPSPCVWPWPSITAAARKRDTVAACATSPQRGGSGVCCPGVRVPGAHAHLLPVLPAFCERREAGGAHGVEGGGVAGHELELAGGLVQEEVEAVGYGGSGLAGGGGQGGGPGVVDDVEDGAGAGRCARLSVGRRGRLRRRGRSISAGPGGRGGCRRG